MPKTCLDNPIPRPPPIENIECDTSKGYHQEDSCYPLRDPSEQSWSLSEVFGRQIRGACALNGANIYKEDVCMRVPSERQMEVQVGDAITTDASVYEDGQLRCWKLPEAGESFDLRLPKQPVAASSTLTRPLLYAARAITGYGQERGGVQTQITNPTAETVQVAYLESLPWYMKPYIHTLRAKSLQAMTGMTTNPIRETYYKPALDRHRGTHLEVLMEVPPFSTATLTYDFDKAILRYTEYPPDANRGFDVAAAVIRLLTPANGPSNGIYVRTTSLLLPLPTPDFSMPYNVIILTSTVMALGFGSFFNLIVRRFVDMDELPPTALFLLANRMKQKLRSRLLPLLARLRRTREKTD